MEAISKLHLNLQQITQDLEKLEEEKQAVVAKKKHLLDVRSERTDFITNTNRILSSLEERKLYYLDNLQSTNKELSALKHNYVMSLSIVESLKLSPVVIYADYLKESTSKIDNLIELSSFYSSKSGKSNTQDIITVTAKLNNLQQDRISRLMGNRQQIEDEESTILKQIDTEESHIQVLKSKILTVKQKKQELIDCFNIHDHYKENTLSISSRINNLSDKCMEISIDTPNTDTTTTTLNNDRFNQNPINLVKHLTSNEVIYTPPSYSLSPPLPLSSSSSSLQVLMIENGSQHNMIMTSQPLSNSLLPLQNIQDSTTTTTILPSSSPTTPSLVTHTDGYVTTTVTTRTITEEEEIVEIPSSMDTIPHSFYEEMTDTIIEYEEENSPTSTSDQISTIQHMNNNDIMSHLSSTIMGNNMNNSMNGMNRHTQALSSTDMTFKIPWFKTIKRKRNVTEFIPIKRDSNNSYNNHKTNSSSQK